MQECEKVIQGETNEEQKAQENNNAQERTKMGLPSAMVFHPQTTERVFEVFDGESTPFFQKGKG